MVTSTQISSSFGSLESLIHSICGTREMTAFTVNHCTIFISKLNCMVIKNFSEFLASSYHSTSSSFSFNRISFFHPVCHVNVVDVLLSDMISAKPVEIVPVSHLIFHLSLLWFSRSYPNSTVIPINLSTDDITYFSCMDFCDGFSIIILIMSLKTHHHV